MRRTCCLFNSLDLTTRIVPNAIRINHTNSMSLRTSTVSTSTKMFTKHAKNRIGNSIRLRDELYQNYLKNYKKIQLYKKSQPPKKIEYEFVLDILFYGSCAIVFYAICEKIHDRKIRRSLVKEDFSDYPYHGL